MGEPGPCVRYLRGTMRREVLLGGAGGRWWWVSAPGTAGGGLAAGVICAGPGVPGPRSRRGCLIPGSLQQLLSSTFFHQVKLSPRSKAGREPGCAGSLAQALSCPPHGTLARAGRSATWPPALSCRPGPAMLPALGYMAGTLPPTHSRHVRNQPQKCSGTTSWLVFVWLHR